VSSSTARYPFILVVSLIVGTATRADTTGPSDPELPALHAHGESGDAGGATHREDPGQIQGENDRPSRDGDPDVPDDDATRTIGVGTVSAPPRHHRDRKGGSVPSQQPATTGAASPAITAPPPAVGISLSPATATLDACKGLVFTANVTNAADPSVAWAVVEPGGGTVTNGIYTAPKAAGTYHVMATSLADPTKTAQAVVTVGPEKVLSVAATPGSVTVQPSGGLAFAATVTTSCGTYPVQ